MKIYNSAATCRSGSEDEFADETVDPRVEVVLEAMTDAMEEVGPESRRRCPSGECSVGRRFRVFGA